MKRHFQRLSLTEIKKRGLILISALILCVGIFNPVKVKAADNALIRVSYVNFYSRRSVDPSTGNDIVNNDDWIVIDFNLDGYYTGTIEYWCQFSKPVLATPELTADGAFYTVNSDTSGNTAYVQQRDTFTFTITNCQHFQIIYHLSSSGGLTFSGNHALTGGNLTKEDGTSTGGINVDYTDLLNGIKTDIDTAIESINGIGLDVTNILGTLNDIKTSLNDFKTFMIYHDMDIYQKTAVKQFLAFGFNWNFNNTWANRWDGWCLTQGTYTTGNIIYLIKDQEYYLIYLTNAGGGSRMVFNSSAGNTFTVTSVRQFGISSQGSYYLATFTPTVQGYYYLESANNVLNVQPVYFGRSNLVPENIRYLIGKDSTPTLLEKIIALFNKNNEQNEEVLQNLQGIQQNQETIDQSIQTFNEDFNTALQDVPIDSTLNELQKLNGAFVEINSWWDKLWDVLGIFKIVIILAMLLALLRIFVGKKS